MLKRKSSRRTHKIVNANPRVINTGVMTQANSIGACVKHFFPCDEGAGVTKVTDIVGGVEINPAANNGHSVATGSSNTVRMLSWTTVGSDLGITGTWTQPGGKDCLIFTVAKARTDSGETCDAGHSSWYVGNPSTSSLKVQPYYAVFNSLAGAEFTLATPFYESLKNRVIGDVYSACAVKRGHSLEHYAEGVKTGEVSALDVPSSVAGFHAAWDNWTPAPSHRCGHSAMGNIKICLPDGTIESDAAACSYVPQQIDRGDGGHEYVGSFINNCVSGSNENAQDYYGYLFCVFEDGAPDDIAEATQWMEEQWILGNKVIWPGWVSLK